MIKEKLEKEAKEYADWFWGASPSMMKALARAYIKGAEPREKRIAELEATNKKISDKCHKLVDSLEKKQKEVVDLEKENAELDCQKNRNKFCYSCANATERCFRNEIGCPCEKYKSWKEENAELKAELDAIDKVGEHVRQQINDAFRNKRPYCELEEQLTKAKEIIKNLVEFDSSYKDDEEYQRKSELYDKMWEEAEQFLNNDIKEG